MFFRARYGLLRKHRSAKSFMLACEVSGLAHAGLSTNTVNSLLGVKCILSPDPVRLPFLECRMIDALCKAGGEQGVVHCGIPSGLPVLTSPGSECASLCSHRSWKPANRRGLSTLTPQVLSRIRHYARIVVSVKTGADPKSRTVTAANNLFYENAQYRLRRR
jgi:hypothetical protein